MKGLPSVGVFLLIFLISTALIAALPPVYFVEGELSFDDDGLSNFGGIYEERSNPRLHYKEIAQPHYYYYEFLYTEPDQPDTWTFVSGTDFSTVE